jgi:pyruvate-formate lyase-activating enzyme
LQNLSARDLQKYLADKFLDESTFARLKELLDTFAAIEKLKADITAQESQRAAIYRSQEQAQKNMQVLAPSGEEGRLRGRYVQQLAQSEEELAQIARTLAQLADNIKQLGEKAQQIMAKLPAA